MSVKYLQPLPVLLQLGEIVEVCFIRLLVCGVDSGTKRDK